MPRQARLDAPGTLHHVMIRGMEPKRIVDDDGDRREFVRRLGKVAVEIQTAIYAWALMTNYAHILLSSGPLGLAKFMRRFLTGYAVGYNLRHGRHGHLFQNRYKSVVCDGDHLLYGAGTPYSATLALSFQSLNRCAPFKTFQARFRSGPWRGETTSDWLRAFEHVNR